MIMVLASAVASDLLTNPGNRDHIALLYDHEDDLYSAIAHYLNEGLARGQFCVYASVHIRDGNHANKISSLIRDYDTHIEKGNLLVVDLASYYISAMVGDMQPFEEAKKMFTQKVGDKADKHIRFVGDGSGFLFKNKHFDECTIVEEWWQQKPFEGSYLCPFSKSYYHSFPHNIYSKRIVVQTHDIVVDLSSSKRLQIENKDIQTSFGGRQKNDIKK